MYSSSYLKWFRRLLILGALVAGLTASAAGARLDPGTPPDVRDVASALSATIVSRPPDVRDAATSVSAASPDVLERYAAAHRYGSGLSSATSPSPVDRIVAQEQGRQHDLGLFSLGFSASTMKADGLRPQGVAPTWEHQLHSPAPASQYPTPAGLKADGLRLRGIARVYEQQSVPVSGGSDFAWDDWAIGVGAGLGLALLLGVGLMVGRQQRHRVQPA